MIGEAARSIGFWTLDALRGGNIRKKIKYLDQITHNRNGNAQALASLLKHASETVPAYRNIDPSDLNHFPVVSKSEYRNDFFSYRSGLFDDDDKLRKVYTSGSTGTPFMAYQDSEKIAWHHAGLICMNNRIGWKLGARFMFMRVWGGAHGAGRLSQIFSNTVPVEVIDFNDRKKEDVRIRILEDKKLHLILGYASALDGLARYILRCKNRPEEYGIKLIIADSENLPNESKALIEKAFGCPVLNRYANNENGILGITRANDNRFFINSPEYYVELLKLDSDEPAPLGECGRIVITDLFNKAFPFIRYDTGDVGIAGEMHGTQCVILDRLIGRISGMLLQADGSPIGEAVITSFFEDMVNIGRYQIIQTAPKKYTFKVEKTASEVELQIIERCHSCFGCDAEVDILHVEEIEQSKNGKYKLTIYDVK